MPAQEIFTDLLAQKLHPVGTKKYVRIFVISNGLSRHILVVMATEVSLSDSYNFFLSIF